MSAKFAMLQVWLQMPGLLLILKGKWQITQWLSSVSISDLTLQNRRAGPPGNRSNGTGCNCAIAFLSYEHDPTTCSLRATSYCNLQNLSDK